MENKALLISIEELLDRKFEGIDRKFEGIDRRLDGIEQELQKHGKILERHEVQLTDISNRMENMEGRMENMEGRMENMEGRMDRVESCLTALQAGQVEIRKDMKRLSDKVDIAYDAAIESWGQITEVKVRVERLEQKTAHLPEQKVS